MARVFGVGPLDPGSGIDLWLRTAAAVRARRPDVKLVWQRTGAEDPDRAVMDAIAHERWHLGLGDDPRFVGPHDPANLAPAGTEPAVVMVTTRPNPPDDAPAESPWAAPIALAAATGAQVVGFAGGGPPPAVDGVQVELVEYPDVDALAEAAVRRVAPAEAVVSRPARRRRASGWSRRR